MNYNLKILKMRKNIINMKVAEYDLKLKIINRKIVG